MLIPVIKRTKQIMMINKTITLGKTNYDDPRNNSTGEEEFNTSKRQPVENNISRFHWQYICRT